MGNYTIFRCPKILEEVRKQEILQQMFRKFQLSKKLLCCTFFGGSVVRQSRSIFFHCRSFYLALVVASISHFVTAATKFSCRSSNKQISPLFFFSLSFDGLPPTFSFSLSFSCSVFQIVDIAINLLSLILQTPRIQKQSPLSVFIFIDSLVVSALQDAGGYEISRQNNPELLLGFHTC